MPKTEPQHSEDSAALRDLLAAMIEGTPRGTLTLLAGELGMQVSALAKRLKRPTGGFDLATMQATILVQRQRREQITEPTRVGSYLIGTEDDKPVWKLAPEAAQPRCELRPGEPPCAICREPKYPQEPLAYGFTACLDCISAAPTADTPAQEPQS